MSDTITVAVQAEPELQAPQSPKAPAAQAPTNAALPGIPLAIAGVNVVGTAAGGLATLGGPVALAAVAGTAGAVALGAAVRRRRSAAKPGKGKAAAQAPARHGSVGAVPRQGAASGLRAATRAAGHRSTAQGGTPNASARSAEAPRANSLHKRANTRPTKASASKSQDAPAAARRTAGDQGVHGPLGRVRHLANKAANSRLQKTEQRREKGRAKAQREAGVSPAVERPPTSPSSLSKPQGKALRRSALRHRARLATAGLLTAAVGLGSALVGNWRHPGKVGSHMRRTWQRLTDRARKVRDKRDAAILGKAAPGTVPVPAEVVHDPNRASEQVTAPTSPALRRAISTLIGRRHNPVTGEAMSDTTTPAFSLSAAADVMLQAATTFDPEVMAEFQTLVDDLPVAFQTIQDVLRVLAEKSAETLPVDPTVVEEIGEGYVAMNRVVAALEQVGHTYRRAHSEDIERVENPRNGLESERKWNV
jgi:hypothetical protein